MKRLAVIPSDPISAYLKKGHSLRRLRDYYNPCRYFDEVYLLSELEEDCPDLAGMRVIHTRQKDFERQLKEFKIDVVRAYGGNWACVVACEHKVPGIPVIVSVHDGDPKRLYDSIKKADIVFCVSEAVKKLVASKYKRQDCLWLLPNRVDFEIMQPCSREKTNTLAQAFPYPYKILHVGRLVKEKNLDTLIKALALLGGDYCVIAIGQGDRKPYEKMARELDVSSRIFFIDAVAYEELGPFYSFADCMCTPSRNEGFGMVFIEALACEAVVVTSDIAPMNEIIKESENGILVKDYESPQDLAEAIKKACTDQSLRTSLKANARKSVEQFERTRIDRLEADFYKRILLMKEEKAFEHSLQ